MGITEGHLEKRGKYWHWRFRLDGQRVKKSLGVASHAEAKRLRQAYIAQYNENPAHVKAVLAGTSKVAILQSPDTPRYAKREKISLSVLPGTHRSVFQ